MRKKYEFDFGLFEFENNVVYGHIKSGSHISLSHVSQLLELSEIHFKQRTFGYISVRSTSYSIDPTVYGYLNQIANLSSIAVVFPSCKRIRDISLEKHFFNGYMRRFENLEMAKAWVFERNSISEFAKNTTP